MRDKDAWSAVVAGAGKRLALLLEDVRCVRCDRARVEIEGEPAALATLARYGPELERLARSATGGAPRVLVGGVPLGGGAPDAGATPTTAPPPVAPAMGTASGAGGVSAQRDDRSGQNPLARLRAEALQEAAANAPSGAGGSAVGSALGAGSPASGAATGADTPRGVEGAPGGAEGAGGVAGAGGALASPMDSELVRAAIELFKARVVGPPKRVPMTPSTGPSVSAAPSPAPSVERGRGSAGGEGSGEE